MARGHQPAMDLQMVGAVKVRQAGEQRPLAGVPKQQPKLVIDRRVMPRRASVHELRGAPNRASERTMPLRDGVRDHSWKPVRFTGPTM